MSVRPITILYVDDDADIRTIVTMALGLDPSIRIVVADGGAAAVARVSAGLTPDLIVLDVMMPEMDGIATLAALRTLPQAAAAPVAFMTARGREADVERYVALGAVAVIRKPFDPLTLAPRLRALVP